MSFNNIIGQEKAKEILLRSIKENKISSSYLFWGKEGVGKKFTALEFAKAINCLHPGEDFTSCENCLSCSKINKLCSPDLNIIEPLKNTISIQQIRDLQHQLNLKPLESKRKFYIIDQAEKMTQEAENCLLKTLEEPPPKVIIILICHHPDYLLPTIISRCQLINFTTLKSENLKRVISNLKQKDLDEDKFELICRLAEGSVGKALNLISKKEYLKKREEILDLLSSISPKKYDFIFFNRIKDILSGTDDQLEEALEIMLFWYRDLLLIQKLPLHQYLFNIDKLSILQEKSKMFSIKRIENILKYLGQIKELLERNINKQLLADELYLKLVGEDSD
ncbi:MAG: DNA polymerase III subunit delta' [Candidatus Caldatribacteriota bacterium]